MGSEMCIRDRFIPEELWETFRCSGCGAFGPVLSFVAMGVLETYFHYRNSGIALVENASSSPDELRALGADANDATELAHLHRTYFGQTRFTGKQKKARAAAVAQNIA